MNKHTTSRIFGKFTPNQRSGGRGSRGGLKASLAIPAISITLMPLFYGCSGEDGSDDPHASSQTPPARGETPDPKASRRPMSIGDGVKGEQAGTYKSEEWDRLPLDEAIERIRNGSDPKDFPGELKKLVAHRIEGMSLPQAVEVLASLPPGDDSLSAINSAFYSLSIQDPYEIFREGQSLESLLPDSHIQAAVIEYGQSLAGDKDPALLSKIDQLDWLSDDQRAIFKGTVLSSWSLKEPVRAFDALNKNSSPSSGLLYHLAHDIRGLDSVLEKRPRELMEAISASENSDNPYTRQFRRQLLGKISSVAGDGDPDKIKEIGSLIEHENSAEFFYSNAFLTLASRDLNAALERLPTLPHTGAKREVLRAILPMIEEYDSGAASLWREELQRIEQEQEGE